MICHGEMSAELRGENGKEVVVYVCPVCLAVKEVAVPQVEVRRYQARLEGFMVGAV